MQCSPLLSNPPPKKKISMGNLSHSFPFPSQRFYWSVVDSQCRLSFQRAPFLRKTEAVQSLFCDSSYLKVSLLVIPRVALLLISMFSILFPLSTWIGIVLTLFHLPNLFLSFFFFQFLICPGIHLTNTVFLGSRLFMYSFLIKFFFLAHINYNYFKGHISTLSL